MKKKDNILQIKHIDIVKKDSKIRKLIFLEKTKKLTVTEENGNGRI